MKAAKSVTEAEVRPMYQRAAHLRVGADSDKLVQDDAPSEDIHPLDRDCSGGPAGNASHESPPATRRATTRLAARDRAAVRDQSCRAGTNREWASQCDAARGNKTRASAPRRGEGASRRRVNGGEFSTQDRKEDARRGRIAWKVRIVPSAETVDLKEWAARYVAFLVRARCRLKKEKTVA